MKENMLKLEFEADKMMNMIFKLYRWKICENCVKFKQIVD